MTTLSPIRERFVLHWGEMGTRWGVNRSVAQIHALLYLAARPLTAGEIADTLALARSNVSTSLKELQGWGLIRMTHVIGDRRDHFDAITDPWQIMLAIAEGRKRRELDPTLSMLRDCMLEADEDPDIDPQTRARIAAMARFLTVLLGWYEEVSRLKRKTLVALVKLGGRVARLLPREDAWR